ncbi:MAG TPA: hypothetical protein VMJ64_15825 [Anaerolineales bacterium]|nr:hypothetical protein [Anaerolineales bacterium]
MLANSRRRLLFNGIIAILMTFISLAGEPARHASASTPSAPPGPDRVATITVNYTAYEWWMATWRKNIVVCSLTVDHKGQPTLGEIYENCGQDVYETFRDQPSCDTANPKLCEGYYLVLIQTSKAQKQVTITLPPPEVWLSLEGCDSVSREGTNICQGDPVLVLQGEEPLPNEHILRIEGTMDGQPFTCDPTCKIRLAPTDTDGVAMQFWAWSSYGDSSEVFAAQVRVAQAADNNPDQNSLYVDVLSSQWKGVRLASCVDTWGTFAPVGGPPPWLSTPQNASDLSSDIPYSYLAANLILEGAVDASACPDGGLVPGGGANQCGQDAARSAAEAWQNQFDELIMRAADDTGVPAQLLKNLFARESQFWPGVFKSVSDAGLGQLTENGADAALLWNPSFYSQYCPLVLSAQTCSQGYLHLKSRDQKLLRAALVSSVNATCNNCALGIDLSRADFSIGVFAHTLLATCEQTGQVIFNTVRQSPGAVASYEDLWKFTLVDYNAGAGCLALALDAAWNADHKLTWDTVSNRFTPVCAPAKDYVNDISQ